MAHPSVAVNPRDARDGSDFYDRLPLFTRFTQLTDPSIYTPLPEGWVLGLADIVRSTAAIEAGGYKAVNTAAAAVIASVANALSDKDFPFVFGGDGANLALPPEDEDAGRQALAAAAAWVRDELGMHMRVALVPVAVVRANGLDVRVARFAPSPDVSYAMFTGGGLAWAERQMKAGAFPVPAAAAGVRPDLTGLSCRFSEIEAQHGVILSLIVVPSGQGDPAAFAPWAERFLEVAESGSDAGRPVPAGGPVQRWPPAGFALEARAMRPVAGSRLVTRIALGVAHARGSHHLQDRAQGRRLRSGPLSPAARREHRLPQVRRRLAHDARLHAGARRSARGSARVGCGGRSRPLRRAPPIGRPDDLLRAVADAQRSRAFRRRRHRRLRRGGPDPQGRALIGRGADTASG